MKILLCVLDASRNGGHLSDPYDRVPSTMIDGALLRTIVDTLPAMVAYWDADLRCRFANRAYERWFGVDPETMPGRRMSEFLGPLYALNQPYIDGALRGEEQEFEREIPDPSGGPSRHSQALYIPDAVGGRVRGFCVLVVDVTRRKRAEEELRQTQRQLEATERLAAISTLAAGIAHEVNNPLASVLGNIELLLDTLERPHVELAMRRSVLEAARDGAVRIKTIIQSMKLLARGNRAVREPVDVNATVEQSIVIAGHAIRYKAKLVRDFGAVGTVEGNGTQLGQVFVNLLVNAAQAIQPGDGDDNEIRVTTRRAGDVVFVEIADTGCGIPNELQARIFEPFFTTKEAGVGSGLGLSISQGLVAAHNGTLSVRSAPGEGAVFTVALPATRPELPRDASPSGERTRSVPKVERTGETRRRRVLIVDDEPLLTRTMEWLLDDCDVKVCSSGREAVSFLVAEQGEIDVILCDLMMPGVSGVEVYNEVTRARPELVGRFVILTGGAFTEQGQSFLSSVPAQVLEKPFTVEALRAAVDTTSVEGRSFERPR